MERGIVSMIIQKKRVNKVDKYMKSHGDVTLDELLKSADIV